MPENDAREFLMDACRASRDTNLHFSVSITTDESSGEPIAVYFYIREGRVHQTREFADGAAMADYNKLGELLGIELLAPCNVSILDQLAVNEPATVRKVTVDRKHGSDS